MNILSQGLLRNPESSEINMLMTGRPGSSNSRLYPRRGSTASSIHSIGGTLDSVSQWHGFNESGQNGMF